jgi:phosphate/sulfate permease
MDIYFFLIIILLILAVIDLIVGVSNDAINFLNSAIGSRVFSFRTIMITASLGIFIGAVFSSGMMEVARKGIFNPGHFSFNDIMVIFLAVMLADILLLDIFNSLGMPTSTTVSIVFDLLGAAVGVGLMKTMANKQDLGTIVQYINTASALKIISGILLSVVIAFSVGAIVMYISRLVFSFQFNVKKQVISTAVFAGISFASITYFIILKGLKGTDFYSDIKVYIHDYTPLIILGSLVFWTIISYILLKFFKINVLHLIILLGTFSLALAFAGNDLVNFIGVPIAGYNSYSAWLNSGIPADEFMMDVLGKKVPTPMAFLIGAAIIMVATLWLSSKAKKVAKTAIDLSAQGEIEERFQATPVSRAVVKGAIGVNKAFSSLIPESTRMWIDSRFRTPAIQLKKQNNIPEFDVIRASVNLLVAAILISIATSMKLPLSTTYVTFMVAMGASLADRAWGRESAVYRIAGVFSVIAGWFLTAFSAFFISFTIAILIYKFGFYLAILFFIGELVMLYLSGKRHKQEIEEEKEELFGVNQENKTIDVEKTTEILINESLSNINKVIGYINKLYDNTVQGLTKYNLDLLKKNDKSVKKIYKQGNKLKDKLYYIIKSYSGNDLVISSNYIKLMDKIQDLIQSIHYVSKSSKEYVDNTHTPLTTQQIIDLQKIRDEMVKFMNNMQLALNNRDLSKLKFVYKTNNLDKILEEAINHQVQCIQEGKCGSKNSRLFLGLLLETKDIEDSLKKLVRVIIEATKSLELKGSFINKEIISELKKEEKTEFKTESKTEKNEVNKDNEDKNPKNN